MTGQSECQELLPTLIVVHPKERRSKCTIEPLRDRDDFDFRTWPSMHSANWQDYVQLGLGGPVLSRRDADHGLLVLDGTWRYADRMAEDYRHVAVRSLPDLETAYPRSSKFYHDPADGLATIEAIYAAYQILGRNTAGLLDGYYWGDTFLEKNAAFFDRVNSET